MLLLNAVLSQFATFVDEIAYKSSSDYAAIPEAVRINTIIEVLKSDGRVSIIQLLNLKGRENVRYAEFMGEVEESFPSAYDLPLRPVSQTRRRVSADLTTRFKQAVMPMVAELETLELFWHTWDGVHQAVETKALQIDWWDQHGRMLLKGEHNGKAFHIPDLLISGIGKHL